MPGVPPKAFETIKAKFKALFKGKKSKKAEPEPTADATKTDDAAPAMETEPTAPDAEATAPEVKATEPATATGETPAPATTADPAPTLP